MRVNSFSTWDNTNASFAAKRFATIDINAKESVELFKVDEQDKVFLSMMAAKIDLKKLLPENTAPQKLKKHAAMIENAIQIACGGATQDNYLAVHNKKPCGIITYINVSNTDSELEYIATWPESKDSKVKYVGTSLILQMFQNAKSKSIKKISLNVLKDSNIDLLKYYQNLGFYIDPTKNHDMVTNSSKYSEAIEKLSKFIKIKETPDNTEEVNLKKELDLNF